MKIEAYTSDRVALNLTVEIAAQVPPGRNRNVRPDSDRAKAVHDHVTRAMFFTPSTATDLEQRLNDFEADRRPGRIRLARTERGDCSKPIRNVDHVMRLWREDIIGEDEYLQRIEEYRSEVSETWMLAYVLGMLLLLEHMRVTIPGYADEAATGPLYTLWFAAYADLEWANRVHSLQPLIDRIAQGLPSAPTRPLDMKISQHLAAARYLIAMRAGDIG